MFKRLLILLATLLPLHVYAALDATLTVTPTYPSAYQKVVLTLSSYSFDVNVATITWSSQGKTLLSGFGQKQLSLTVGNVGQIIPISYKAVTANGDTITGSISLTPQSVDLMYESKESYVPPFYGGKALPGEGANLRVIAFPAIYESGARLSPSGLSYSWYINGEYAERISGAGRQSAIIPMKVLTDSTEIKVMIRSPRGNVAERTITVYPNEALPILYPYDEVLGVDYTKPFMRRMELARDTTVSLEPFYFSSKAGLDATATYAWYLDGLPITPQEKTLISLRPSGNSFGTKKLSVLLENSKRLLQKSRADIEVIFDARN